MLRRGSRSRLLAPFVPWHVNRLAFLAPPRRLRFLRRRLLVLVPVRRDRLRLAAVVLRFRPGRASSRRMSVLGRRHTSEVGYFTILFGSRGPAALRMRAAGCVCARLIVASVRGVRPVRRRCLSSRRRRRRRLVLRSGTCSWAARDVPLRDHLRRARTFQSPTGRPAIAVLEGLAGPCHAWSRYGRGSVRRPILAGERGSSRGCHGCSSRQRMTRKLGAIDVCRAGMGARASA